MRTLERLRMYHELGSHVQKPECIGKCAEILFLTESSYFICVTNAAAFPTNINPTASEWNVIDHDNHAGNIWPSMLLFTQGQLLRD